MAKVGLIPKELADVDPPMCPGCAYGKAHRKQWRYKGIQNLKKIRQATYAGEVVSIDQLQSPTPGFVPIHRGKPTNQRYIGATVFVDHFSDLTYVHLMTELTAQSTVEAKLAFERYAKNHKVIIKHYHSDNGLFDTKAFKESIRLCNQTLSFCGVNAHHQNGRAERKIKNITEGARTALLHASHRWPKAIHASLWPSALKNYVNLHNNIPTNYLPSTRNVHDKRFINPGSFTSSPFSKFSGVETKINLKHYHPFGCPVYVLDEKLQSGHAHNKWSDRTRVGIFLCHSPLHSSNVPLILNTRTGNVTPQFHCLYDDDFDTCKRDTKFISLWQHKAKVDMTSKPKPLNDMMLPIQSLQPGPRQEKFKDKLPPEFIDSWDPPSVNPSENSNDKIVQPPTPSKDVNLQNPSTTRTRYGRTIVPPTIFDPSPAATARSYNAIFSQSYSNEDNHLLQPQQSDYSEPNPFASICETIYGMVATDPDTMHLHEALQQEDREHFIEAMTEELKSHIKRKHWKIVPLKSVPKGKRCLPMVWSMKRKKNPLGEIIKYKARLCVGGHRSIEFVDYWDTYSPVVSWQTIRLMFVLAIVNNWHIRSIDFVLAFPQADVKTDIYLKPPPVPTTFKIPDLPNISDRFTKVYKLLKNLYGLKDAGRTWNQHLKQGLIKRGWNQSPIDECLFTKRGIMLILYVDDACLISPSNEQIDKEIKSLQVDYDLTDDGELSDYLGTRFTKLSNGTVHLTMPRMIERVLDVVGLNHPDSNVKSHDTPATTVLQPNQQDTPRLHSWNYRSAVGCLSYLQAMIRPDITFAVQQCSRFNNNPTREHELAIKRICRYILRTKDKGLLLKPDRTKGLECHVDADWAGSWTHHSNHDPMSTHSRTGFVISYAGCPILWKSKLQSIIALSTAEAEYIALSTALREVISIIHLLDYLKQQGFPIHGSTPKFTCKTFEDNQSCIKLATDHRIRPRSKHFALRLHHFRSYVLNKTITIEHIDTKSQQADIFTKPLSKTQFQALRLKLMHW